MKRKAVIKMAVVEEAKYDMSEIKKMIAVKKNENKKLKENASTRDILDNAKGIIKCARKEGCTYRETAEIVSAAVSQKFGVEWTVSLDTIKTYVRDMEGREPKKKEEKKEDEKEEINTANTEIEINDNPEGWLATDTDGLPVMMNRIYDEEDIEEKPAPILVVPAALEEPEQEPGQEQVQE